MPTAIRCRDEWPQRISEDAAWHPREGATTREEASPSVPVEVPPRPRRILIVDDSAGNRSLVRAMLKADGYELSDAADGASALQMIMERKPDLVLLDLMMPIVDGFTVIKRLRADVRTAGLPIIVLTAMAEAEAQVQSLELGADDYMAKPFDPKVLRSRVQALFQRRDY